MTVLCPKQLLNSGENHKNTMVAKANSFQDNRGNILYINFLYFIYIHIWIAFWIFFLVVHF